MCSRLESEKQAAYDAEQSPIPLCNPNNPRLTSSIICHLHHPGSVCHNAHGMNIYQQSGTIKISESDKLIEITE